MNNKVLLMFLLCGLYAIPCGGSLGYHFVNINMTWVKAQQYCKKNYTDLATITSLGDIATLSRPSGYKAAAWIGLFDDTASWKSLASNANSWKWSATETMSASGYQNWGHNNPDYERANESCVALSQGLWMDFPCSKKLHFVCYRGSSPKTFDISNSALTWSEALEYCIEHYEDLAMIESDSENQEVNELVSKFGYLYVWIGLYREPWRWSDGSVSKFTNWRRGQPDNAWAGEHCVVEDSEHFWIDVSCDLKRPFICQGELKDIHLLKMQFRSALDLTDPRNYQLILQKVQEELDKTGRSDVKIKWKTTPTKKNKN